MMRKTPIVLLALALLAGLAWLLHKTKTTQQAGIGKIVIHGLSADVLTVNDQKSRISFKDQFGQSWFQNMPADIRIRGNSSSFYPKKPLAIQFQEAVPLAGLAPRKHWILVANYFDRSHLRNKLAYDWFQSWSTQHRIVQSRWVEVYLGTDYYGLFLLVERPDRHSLGLSPNGGLLFKDPPLHFPPKEHAQRYADFRAYFREDPKYDKFDTEARRKMIDRSYFNQRFPKWEQSDASEAIYQLTEIIFHAPDEQLFQDLDEQISMLSIMDWHLLLLFTNNYDGIKKNFLLYRPSRKDRFHISPWDYDHSFGRDADGEPHRDSLIDFQKVPLLGRLSRLNAGGYNQKLLARYLALFREKRLHPAALHQFIDNYTAWLLPHTNCNEARWPHASSPYLAQLDFATEIDFIKNWIDHRFALVERYLRNLPGNETPIAPTDAHRE